MLYILDSGGPQVNDARTILQKELGHPAKTIVIVRGDSPPISTFVSDAAQVADRPWRVVVWVKNREIFTAGQEEMLFGNHSDAIAVLLDFQDNVARYFTAVDTLVEVDDAFTNVEKTAKTGSS